MLDKLKAAPQLLPLIRWIKDCFQSYYLLHIQVGSTHANTVIAGSVADFLIRKESAGVVMHSFWRISRKEYLRVQAAKEAHKASKKG